MSRSIIVVVFTLILVAISVIIQIVELLSPSIVWIFGLTSTNWWGIVTSIPLHYYLPAVHLLPNIEGIFIVTALFSLLVWANLYENPRNVSIFYCVTSLYAAVLANGGFYFVIPTGKVSYGLSGVIFAMTGILLAASFMAYDAISRKQKAIGKSFFRRGPYDKLVSLNFTTYIFTIAIFGFMFQPTLPTTVGVPTPIPNTMAHLVSFGVGLSAGLVYFDKKKVLRLHPN